MSTTSLVGRWTASKMIRTAAKNEFGTAARPTLASEDVNTIVSKDAKISKYMFYSNLHKNEYIVQELLLESLYNYQLI